MKITLTLSLLLTCSLLFSACKPETSVATPPDNTEPASNKLGEGKLGEMRLGA